MDWAKEKHFPYRKVMLRGIPMILQVESKVKHLQIRMQKETVMQKVRDWVIQKRLYLLMEMRKRMAINLVIHLRLVNMTQRVTVMQKEIVTEILMQRVKSMQKEISTQKETDWQMD